MKNTEADRWTIKRALRPHLLAYGGVSVALFVIDYFMTGPLWFHWPVMAWGVIAGAHLLYCKSIDVDEDWAARRTLDIRMKSFDLGHIKAIDDSYRKETEHKPPTVASGR